MSAVNVCDWELVCQEVFLQLCHQVTQHIGQPKLHILQQLLHYYIIRYALQNRSFIELTNLIVMRGNLNY